MKPGDRHLMVDLETLGTGPNAVILCCGWAEFDPSKGDRPIKLTGEVSFPLEPQTAAGREVESGTVSWWLRTDQPLFNRLLARSVQHVGPEAYDQFMRALLRLSCAVRQTDYPTDRSTYVWAYGTTFDITLLQELFSYAHGAMEAGEVAHPQTIMMPGEEGYADDFKTPWHYQNVMDLRTLVSLNGGPGSVDWPTSYDGRALQPHDPVDDCIAQACVASHLINKGRAH